MKVIQIFNGFCHWDATRFYASIAAIPPNTYAPDTVFVDAPDYVFEGWGYDDVADGDARFIEPTPPNGWLYDAATGTFYPDPNGPYAPTPEPDLLAEADALILALTYENLLLKGGLEL